jgi:NADPH2:quinone reductase
MAKAARVHEHGAPLVVEDVELPDPAEGEVRVDMAFAGVNPVDAYIAQGRVAPDGPLPRTLGGEGAGIVDGRPVLLFGFGLGTHRDGVWSEQANVPEAAAIPVPDGVALEQAAAAGIVGLTAWNTVHLAQVTDGDRALVLGASGGVGTALVSLLKSRGATVWGQTGSAEKGDVIWEQGADHVVVAGADGLAEGTRDLRATVVFDPLGGPFTAAALGTLVPKGRLVIFGTSAGPEGTVQLQQLYRNGLRVLGYGGLLLDDDERRTGLGATLEAMAAGQLRIPVDRVLPLAEVNDAFAALKDRALRGKVVLDLR